jgi:ADP-heptose:LPS heptosyltransferase
MSAAGDASFLFNWVDGKSLSQVEQALAELSSGDDVLIAADRLADAADSDDEDERAEGLRALFGGFIEPLSDSFSKAGRAAYARLFSAMVWRVANRERSLSRELRSLSFNDYDAFYARYNLARSGTTPLPKQARKIAVLSRVTLGADILITSLALQRLRQRYPEAELLLIGDAKLGGLFSGLPGVRVVPVSYSRRGALRDRLSSWLAVRQALTGEGADLALSPDSRLDQLGVLPVIEDPNRYLLWENTQPSGQPLRSLAMCFDDWLVRRLELPAEVPAHPRVAFDAATAAVAQRLKQAFGDKPIAAVKLDHGGNPAKALPRAAELMLLNRLHERGWRILLDRGFGEQELANSDQLVNELGWSVRDIDDSERKLGLSIAELKPDQLAQEKCIRFHGSIAGWAAAASSCQLAFSYDSVGHHLAAALGVPVLVAFTGFSHPEFPIAWQPRGPGSIMIVTFNDREKNDHAHWQRLFDAVPDSGKND